MFWIGRRCVRLNIPAVLLIIMSVALNGVKNANQGEYNVKINGPLPLSNMQMWCFSPEQYATICRANQAGSVQEQYESSLKYGKGKIGHSLKYLFTVIQNRNLLCLATNSSRLLVVLVVRYKLPRATRSLYQVFIQHFLHLWPGT